MLEYRLYRLGRDGTIDLPDWIKADSDDAALAKALEVARGTHKVEVWQEKRLVAELGPHDLFG